MKKEKTEQRNNKDVQQGAGYRGRGSKTGEKCSDRSRSCSGGSSQPGLREAPLAPWPCRAPQNPQNLI